METWPWRLRVRFKSILDVNLSSFWVEYFRALSLEAECALYLCFKMFPFGLEEFKVLTCKEKSNSVLVGCSVYEDAQQNISIIQQRAPVIKVVLFSSVCLLSCQHGVGAETLK